MGHWLQRTLFAVAIGSSLLAGTSASRAQDESAAAQVPIAGVAPSLSDHELIVRRVGLGWYGFGDLPLPTGTLTPDAADPSVLHLTPTDLKATVQVPSVGVRYWFNPGYAVDAAIGFASKSGSIQSDLIVDGRLASDSQDLQSYTAILVHGGFPIGLGGGKHIGLGVAPEIDVGFTSGTIRTPNAAGTGVTQAPVIDQSGFMLQVGVGGGAELYFGFIGVPELALGASVGVYFRRTASKLSAGYQSIKLSDTSIETVRGADPWDIFKATVAARYYF